MSKFNLLNPTLKVSLIAGFFQQMITTAFLPFIALYLTEMISAQFTGLFLSLLVLTTIPLDLYGGYIIDTFAKRKIILTYQFFMSLMLLAMAFALIDGPKYIVYFCIAYTIFVIFFGLQFPAMDAIVMDAVTPEVENYVFKFGYWLDNIAIAVGMFLGGYLYHSNKSIILLVAAAIFFLVFLSLKIWLPKEAPKTQVPRHSSKAIFTNYAKVFKDKQYMILLVSTSLIMSAELSMSSYVALRLQQNFQDVSFLSIPIDDVKMFSVIMITNTLTIVLLSYIIHKGYHVFSEKYFFLSGLIFYILGYVNLTYLNSFWFLIIAMMVAASGEIIFSPVIQEKRYKMIPEHLRGSYSALGNLGYSLAELIARFGILLGTFLNVFGMSMYTLVILVMGAIGIYVSVNRYLSNGRQSI